VKEEEEEEYYKKEGGMLQEMQNKLFDIEKFL